MKFVDLVRGVTRYWPLALAGALVGVLVGLCVALATPKTYTSDTQVFFGLSGATSVNDASNAATYATAQIPTYASLVSTPVVLDPVISSLKLDMTSDELASKVSAAQVSSTFLIDITATDASPQRAHDIAAAVATSLGKQVTTLSPLRSSTKSPLNFVTTVVAPASTPSSPTSPNRTLDMTLGGAAGLALGLVAAWVLGRRRQTQATSDSRQSQGAAPARGQGSHKA